MSAVEEDALPVSALVQITDASTDTIQRFLADVGTALATSEIVFVAMYSPEIRDDSKIHLLASTDERVSPLILRRDNLTSPYTAKLLDGQFFLVIRSRKMIPASPLLDKLLSLKMWAIISNKRRIIRRHIVSQSYRSKDINSFSYRILAVLREQLVYCDDLSIFLTDRGFRAERGFRLMLSSSSSPLSGLEKKDIFYFETEKTNTVTAYTDCRVIVEDENTGFLRETFDGNINRSPLITRGFWPICEMAIRENQGDTSLPPIGTLRVVNISRHGIHGEWHSRFTQYDQNIIGFIAEVFFGLAQQYRHVQELLLDVSRFTHGLGGSIDASIKFAAQVKERLFVPEEDGGEGGSRLRVSFNDATSLLSVMQEVGRDIGELENFLNDLHFQFSRVNAKSYPIEVVDSLHHDVLMPIVRLAPAVAAVNSRSSPFITNLRDAGSLGLPKVRSSAEGLIVVFRNLIENSIKYTKGATARICFSFSSDEQFVYVNVRDYGIGIKREDEIHLFAEGFRSLEARLTNNRGGGLGLAFSQHVMRSLQGDLFYSPCNVGSMFTVKIRRAT